MLRILCVEPLNYSPTLTSRAFLRLQIGRDAMSELSNAEVFNRWKHCKKQTAKDYWYDFLKSRADRNYPDAQAELDKMNFHK